MPYFKDQATTTKDRIICGFSYLSMGMIGLLAYLLQAGKQPSSFFRFHFYQSILLGIFITMFNWAGTALLNVFGGLSQLVAAGSGGALGFVAIGLDLVGKAMLLVCLYGAVFAFLGKLCDIPGISKLARMQMR